MSETNNLDELISLAPSGFKVVKDNPYFMVNEDGEVWGIFTKRLVKKSNGPGGYKIVSKAIGDKKTRSYYVHRLVATAFIEIPKAVLELTDEPEVNHKDGNKKNNKKSNLEWVTAKRNIRHSIDTGLTNHKPVEARNTKTGKIIKFSTATDCAEHFGINFKRLRRHLESKKAGLLTKNWFVFRYADTCDWPHIPEYRLIENRWDQPHGMYFVQHIETGIIGFSETMQKLAASCNMPFSSIQSIVRTDGKKYKLNGHMFWYDEYPEAKFMAKSSYVKEHKFSEVRKIKVHDFKLNKTTVYDSARSAAKMLGLSPTRLAYYLKNSKPHDNKAYWYVN